MHHKLKVNQTPTTLDELEVAWQALPEGRLRRKVNAIRGIVTGLAKYPRRKEYAGYYGVTSRTLIRWIHQFNTLGLSGMLESPRVRLGRKRIVSQKDFCERVLPAAEQSLHLVGQQTTIKALFQAAQRLGLFSGSYSTFRRCMGTFGQKYRRQRIEPNFEEWLYHTQTGRWPSRLKAFGRRRETLQRQHFRLALKRWRAEWAQNQLNGAELDL